MKKFLLTMLCAMMTLTGMAQSKNYYGDLVVTINEESTAPQHATINFFLNEDMTCNFALNNFCLDAGDGNIMPVGNIKLQNLPLSPLDETHYAFSYEGNLFIEEGTLAGVDQWLGPLLGEIPLKLVGKVSMEEMVVEIDIDMMESIGQIIKVSFVSGDDIDLTNALAFVDDLVVSINGESTDPQQATVYLAMNEDGTCNFILKNFCLDAGDGNIMPVGNIFVPNLVPVYAEDGQSATLAYEDIITISEGDLPGVDQWLGPLLEEIPLKLTAKSNMEKIYVTIDIDMMESLGQIIYVTFGSDYDALVDAINKVMNEKSAQAFDLQGRRVQNMKHGLYIQNGKKIMK